MYAAKGLLLAAALAVRVTFGRPRFPEGPIGGKRPYRASNRADSDAKGGEA